MKNPLLLAVLFSMVILAFDIELPFVVTKTVNLLTGGATPIILISLGIFLARELPKVKYKYALELISLKLVFMPSIFFIYFLLNGKTDILAISVLEAGMPLAIAPFIGRDLPYGKGVNSVVYCHLLLCVGAYFADYYGLGCMIYKFEIEVLEYLVYK